MKTLKEFVNQKVSLKEMNTIVGGDSQCSYVETTTKGNLCDVKTSTYNEAGDLVSLQEKIVQCDEYAVKSNSFADILLDSNLKTLSGLNVQVLNVSNNLTF